MISSGVKSYPFWIRWFVGYRGWSPHGLQTFWIHCRGTTKPSRWWRSTTGRFQAWKLLNMAIEIVSFPIKHGDFPSLCKRLPEGRYLCRLTWIFTGFFLVPGSKTVMTFEYFWHILKRNEHLISLISGITSCSAASHRRKTWGGLASKRASKATIPKTLGIGLGASAVPWQILDMPWISMTPWSSFGSEENLYWKKKVSFWWFGTWLDYFPFHIWDVILPNWLSYFSRWLLHHHPDLRFFELTSSVCCWRSVAGAALKKPLGNGALRREDRDVD